MLIFINETLQSAQRSLENLKKHVSHFLESHHPTKCLWESFKFAHSKTFRWRAYELYCSHPPGGDRDVSAGEIKMTTFLRLYEPAMPDCVRLRCSSSAEICPSCWAKTDHRTKCWDQRVATNTTNTLVQEFLRCRSQLAANESPDWNRSKHKNTRWRSRHFGIMLR